MKNRRVLSPIARIAERASKDSFFLGSVITEFKASRRMNDTQLGHFLKCKVDALAVLALCRKPDMEEECFQRDIQRIAEFAGCNPDKLVQLVREATSFKTLRETTKNETAFLAAARDSERKDEDDKKET